MHTCTHAHWACVVQMSDDGHWADENYYDPFHCYRLISLVFVYCILHCNYSVCVCYSSSFHRVLLALSAMFVCRFIFSAIFGQVNVCWHFMVRWHHVFMHFLSLAHFDFSCMLTLTSSDWKWFWIESGTQLKNVKCFELFSERVTQEKKKAQKNSNC